MFEQYEHHYKDGKSALVWVRSDLRGKFRENCLCYSCANFHPGEPNNCPLAQELFEYCVRYNMATPVYECPVFEPIKGA